MLQKVPGLTGLFFDKTPEFSWHPGMLIEGSEMQVPFLDDLVTLADPTSPYTYLNYLHEHDRLTQFSYFHRLEIPRKNIIIIANGLLHALIIADSAWKWRMFGTGRRMESAFSR